jgi:hypothetical protein
MDGRGLGLLGALAGLHEQADGHHEGGDQPAGEGGGESDQECVEDVLPVHGLLLGLGS